MKSLKKKRRIQILIAAALAIGLAAVLIGYGFQDGINLYRAPTQVVEEPPSDGEVFRLGGLVEDGTLTRGAGETISFSVTDGDYSILAVHSAIARLDGNVVGLAVIPPDSF